MSTVNLPSYATLGAYCFKVNVTQYALVSARSIFSSFIVAVLSW